MEAFADNGRSEGGLDVKQQKLERECQEEKDELPLHTDDLFPQIDLESYGHQRKANQAEPSVTTNGFLETPSPNPETIEQEPTYIFSKAANIIREAFEVEGCLFFDVTLGSYRTPKVHSLASGITAGATNQLSSTSSSDEQVQTSPSGEPDGPCKVLGFSTTLGSSINDTESFRGPDGEVSKQLLAKLLRRYPNGRIFSFDAVGELQSSDSSDDGGSLVTERTTDDISDPYVEAGEELTFPSARSVAFFPIWDSKRERWLSGGFAYTLTPTRIFSIEGELSLLKAFGRLVASDVLNLQTLQTEKAKSDVLGSISHELRSPLHGVILGTELLNDTDLTVFQGNATHTIETCCRTLLDTIDHLLDFSKVNNFAAKRKKEASAVFRRTRNRTRSDQFGKMSLYSYTSLDGLVEDVAECTFAGFNFQYMSVRQLSKPGESNQTDQEAHSRLDSVQAMEQLGPTPDGLGRSATTFNDVSISLSIEPGCNWVFHVPAGAIRRIVMNLFGNSLKYTTYGTIRISLSQEAPKRPREERTVKLTVHDTGKGMSEDYLQHGLFKPFSQEDELASGTGLGLSLVKKIVSQLRGKVFVESQVGFGTTVTVTIPLQQSSQHSDTTLLQSEDDKMFQKRVRELKGLRARVSGFESRQSLGDRGTIEDICQRWLLLAMVADNETPDVVLWSEDALPESFEQIEQLRKNPNIVVCQDALAAHERFALFESAGHGGIFEFISQP
ncbi:hypothetical protein PLIIFM63780_010420 [Purpureocillium lilacinum]|nr:hypothetical protein PLIIFM63780_010420 [Purpureocillium lilacinum]